MEQRLATIEQILLLYKKQKSMGDITSINLVIDFHDEFLPYNGKTNRNCGICLARSFNRTIQFYENQTKEIQQPSKELHPKKPKSRTRKR